MNRKRALGLGWALATAWAVVGACGCAGPPYGVVQARHAAQFGCDEDSVQVKYLDGSAWMAAGCGRKATYVCIQSLTSTVCTLDSVDDKAVGTRTSK